MSINSMPSSTVTTAQGPLPMRGVVIFVQNRSTLISDEEVLKARDAVQKQLDQDVFPVWGKSAELRVLSKNTQIPVGAYRVLLEDFTDVAGNAGYHRTEQIDGVLTPLARIFIGTLKKAEMEWTAAFSQETMEMLMDPFLDESVQTLSKDGKFLFVLRELGDAVGSQAYIYKIDNVPVSNFVFPSWFRREGVAPYDKQGVLKAPLTLGINGYAYAYNVYLGIGWKETTSNL